MNDGKSIETGGVAGANEFENLHEIVKKARQNLSQNAWDTLVGGTETETTLKRNRLALDARIAIDHGVDWIYVSNHGGRQLDHGRGSMEVLPEIVDVAAGRAKVMIDGSFCRGTDIIKAIGAGADLVALGRMQCYALAAGGEATIVRMLELIEDEVRRSLALLGVTSFAELDRSHLHPAAPTTSAGVLSAFPLLDIGDDCG